MKFILKHIIHLKDMQVKKVSKINWKLSFKKIEQVLL